MSTNFGPIDFAHLTFPNHLRVDYVRVYQKPNAIKIGCDPKDFPTADYIARWAAPTIAVPTSTDVWRGKLDILKPTLTQTWQHGQMTTDNLSPKIHSLNPVDTTWTHGLHTLIDYHLNIEHLEPRCTIHIYIRYWFIITSGLKLYPTISLGKYIASSSVWYFILGIEMYSDYIDTDQI